MELRIVKVPMHDTGIGREAGYENDAGLIAAWEAERAAMDPQVRALVDAQMAEECRAFISGTSR